MSAELEARRSIRARTGLYVACWLAFVAVLSAVGVRDPAERLDALQIYAVVMWLAAIAINVFESILIVRYLQRQHPFYLGELRKEMRREYSPLPVVEYALVGAKGFLDSTDSLGDSSLPVYRQRVRHLRWMMLLVFVHLALVIFALALLASHAQRN